MSAIISLIGSKGGTGKTTLAHLLCFGLGLMGRKAVCVLTDPGRLPPPHGALPYVSADGRDAQARQRILTTLRSREGWVGVVDGGANRLATDMEMYRLSDLVLLPFRDSQEDLRVVCEDLKRLPNALALPTQWPSNPWQFGAAQRLLETVPAELQGRVLAPVFALSCSKQLLQHPQPSVVPTSLRKLSQAFAFQMLGLLEADRTRLNAAQTALGASRRLEDMMENAPASVV
ncbi:MAG: hypothetical protein CGU28_16565 [Candidatus Dactylopiibacterium carminicum]|uniref:CobQ/CobB/MinD/ParA nucleotide binding domain-containing protein n=1 Tax=Candidatus Dactylopiibacterium carminicum TaxID=857335 RepID=A0A272EMS8_9RHOO|nr:hypothetical protein [Candidatus Dactylopiibacterium carminicum]KAF7597798.1 hypothetical protein BGI27_16775 [Candidatus Dactylopiibacterium carminicum]PAS91392.1 MAG: hypothetical protein CGU29_16725 [Candidatus Dactylopiibacterium carminicum]PAS92495.1 MAG: hypothetical protein CGU28_16565 [Candidatus Dactylopiibacterium carminicum]PAS95591.1 MAG: hypothetical protein BSR46_16805 [Candidatus Dactylopiibacterium carminicum]